MAQSVEKGKFELFDASAYRVGMVAAQFNRDVSSELLEAALTRCEEYGIGEESITVMKVPGCIEVSVVLKALAETKQYDCLVALGVIIRGETPHFDYVARIVSDGVLRVMLDAGLSIGFGILTCENHSQALARVHVGGEAVEAALQSARLIRSIQDKS